MEPTTPPSPIRTAVAGFFVLAFAMGVGRFAFTPLLPVMQSENLLSVGEGGTLASVHFVGYVMGALLAGRLMASPRVMLGAALIAVGLSTAAMGLGHDFALWAVARWIAGLASAVALVGVSFHVAPRLAAAGRSDLQGVVFSGVGVGTAAVGMVMLWAMATGASSDAGWLGFGAVSLLGVAAVALAPAVSAPADAPKRTARSRRGAFGAWRLTLPYGVMGAGYVIPATYLPVMAKQSIADPLVFGWSWPIFGLAAAVSTLVAGRAFGRRSNRAIWIVCQLAMAIGVVAPAVWPTLAAVILAGVAVGGTFVVVTMAGLREAHRTAPPGEAQSRLAAMTTAFALGQILGPIAAGWAYDASGGFALPLLVAGVLLAASLAPLAAARATAPG